VKSKGSRASADPVVLAQRNRRHGRQHTGDLMTARTAVVSIRQAAIAAAVLALLCLPSVAAGSVSPLPSSDYTVHAVCAKATRGRAGCLALQLVPRTAAARARRHPLGFTRSAPLTAPSPGAGAFGLRPQDLHTAYDLPTSASSAQTVALVDAYNDPNAEADLKAYDEEFALPVCTAANGCFKQVNQNGEAGNPPFPKTTKELESARKGSRSARIEAEEATGWGLEISLDIEVTHATCQSCEILLVESNSPTYEDLEAAEKSAAALGAGEISNSWGGPEDGETPELESASPFNHPGIVVTVAAGDDGYLDWDAEGASERGYADFPASSPHVVAVGGTRLSLGSGSAWTGETVWNGDGATGGGCSVVFTAQPWQQSLSNWSGVGCGAKRAVADVSADADPYTGVAVRDTSPECEYSYEEAKVKHVLYWCTIGGTSVSSPLIASTFALAGGADKVEYPAKTLYENEVKSPGSLHDVATGSNGECTKPFSETGLSGCTTAEEGKSCASKAICVAGTGYDGPTGVGTPDGIAAFKPAISAPTVSLVSPSSGSMAGGTNIRIIGTGFVAGAKVEVGQGSGAGPTAIQASNVVVVSSTEITATTGASPKAGTWNLFVVDSGGTSPASSGDDYTYKSSPPTVSSVSPASGSVNGGTPIKITGAGFVAGATVEIGQGGGAGPTAIPASNVVVVSSTEITATTGGGAKAGTFNLFVIDSGGTSTANTGDDYTYK
jgi:Fe2+ transport system protein FeoA